MTPTVILTRPQGQSEGFATALQAASEDPLKIIISPLIKIVPVNATWDGADAVILTSVNGVTAAKRLDVPKRLTAWCVGPKTAEQARAAGFDVVTGPGDAEGLLDEIMAARPVGRLAHIRGRHARGDIAVQLQNAGIPCADVVAYDQQARQLSAEAKAALAGEEFVILPLFSPRTAAIFLDEGQITDNVRVVAISKAVSDALPADVTQQVTLADRPDGNAMMVATLNLLKV